MQRENKYDLLRTFSALAVICIHVSQTYVDGATSTDLWGGQYYTEHMLTSCLYNSLSRFAVPCFIMLSGAFTLDNPKNADFKFFYRKTLTKIGIPTIIFSFLYLLYSCCVSVTSVIVGHSQINRMFKLFIDLIKGLPYYHMWYLYMMILVYLLTPIIIRLKRDIGEKNFVKVAVTFLPFAMLSAWTSQHELYWDLGLSFCYLGYYMIGYVIRKRFEGMERNLKGYICIFFGLLIELVAAYLKYIRVSNGQSDDQFVYSVIGPYAPFICLASLFIFTGFSLLSIKKRWAEKIAGKSMLIYLFHAGIWNVMSHIIISFIGINHDNRIAIPVSIIIVFIVSYVCSTIYELFWKKIDNKYSITTKIVHLV